MKAKPKSVVSARLHFIVVAMVPTKFHMGPVQIRACGLGKRIGMGRERLWAVEFWRN